MNHANSENRPDKGEMSLLQARGKAQHLAFGPIVFQATRLIWKSGLLKAIEDSGDRGISLPELAEVSDISAYGIGVLLEVAVSAELVYEQNDKFTLTKVGSILLHDKLTQVNVDFVHDTCYEGMFFLEDAIREEKPKGLKVFSDAETIYQCMTDLPDDAQTSWYTFNHFYSDRAFKEAAEIVFKTPVTNLLDVGGNTGKWALRCLKKSNQVRVTITDLPRQLVKARELLGQSEHSDRVTYHEANLLDPACPLPENFDVIWMSQFLDCFSEAEIGQILNSVKPALASDGRVFIMETMVDRQRFEAASYSLNAISLYFTTMANGNSRMYRGTTLERILIEEGFEVVNTFDDVGLGHTLLECKPV
jgi:ubiquinone/menaquinone biosynthesis C-methylase UbiE